jgi:hypothetical protein
VCSARQLLKTLLEQPLRFENMEEAGRRRYRILGTGIISLSGKMREIRCSLESGVPNGIRTRVAGLKGRRPRPG